MGDDSMPWMLGYSCVVAVAVAQDAASDALVAIEQLAGQSSPDAIAELRRLTESAERSFGADHPVVAVGMSSLGLALLLRGDQDGAAKWIDDAFDRASRVGLDDTLEFALLLEHVGALELAGGNVDEARHLIERARGIRVARLGPDHPALARSAGWSATVSRAEADAGREWLELVEGLRVVSTAPGYEGERAQILIDLAILDLKDGAYGEALARCEQSLRANNASSHDDEELEARVHDTLGTILLEQGELGPALEAYERGYTIRERLLGQDHPDFANSANNLGSYFVTTGDIRRAYPFLQAAADAWSRAYGPDNVNTVIAHVNLGAAARSQGDFSRARELWEQSAATLLVLGGPDDPTLADVWNNLGVLCAEMGDLPEAKLYLERSLEVRARVLGPDHPSVAEGFHNLGSMLQQAGEYPAARSAIERSLAIRERSLGPAHPEVAAALNSLGHLLRTMGRPSEARALYERALRIREAAWGPDHVDVAVSLNNLGRLLVDEGEYARARPLYDRALTLLQANLGPDHPRVADMVNNLAVLASLQGDVVTARALTEQALASRERGYGPNHPAVAESLSNLGNLMSDAGDFVGAEAAYMRSLAIREATVGPTHPHVALVLGNLAFMFKEMGAYDEAARVYERSLAIETSAYGPDHPKVALTLTNLATIRFRLGQTEGLEDQLHRSIDIVQRAYGPDHRYAVGSVNLLAAMAERRGDIEAARSFRGRALGHVVSWIPQLDGLSEREALAYVTSVRPTFDAWLALFDRPTDARAAWGELLRWKGVVARQIRFRQIGGTIEDPQVAAAFTELSAVRRQRAAHELTARTDANRAGLERQLEDLRGEQERLERVVAAASVKWRENQVLAEVGPDDVCGAMPEGAVLVDFVRYVDTEVPRYAAFVVTAPCSVVRVDLGDADTLERAIADWRALLARPETPTHRVDARGALVAELLWAPLAPLITGYRRVLLVPDGALAAVPFAALPWGEGSYVVEAQSTIVLAEAQDLLRSNAVTPNRGALVVGGLDYGTGVGASCVGAVFDPLPGTEVEATAFQDAWRRHAPRREPVERLGGGEAVLPTIERALTGRRVLHLATHGYFSPGGCIGLRMSNARVAGGDPMVWSGLALSGANESHPDGVLTARALAMLELRGTQLMVLSACESGLGVITTGEGVSGLQRAAAIAGADQLLTALWTVPDDATEHLMTLFYARALTRRGVEHADQALRQAQLALLAEGRGRAEPRPQDWGSFALSGLPMTTPGSRQNDPPSQRP